MVQSGQDGGQGSNTSLQNGSGVNKMNMGNSAAPMGVGGQNMMGMMTTDNYLPEPMVSEAVYNQDGIAFDPSMTMIRNVHEAQPMMTNDDYLHDHENMALIDIAAPNSDDSVMAAPPPIMPMPAQP